MIELINFTTHQGKDLSLDLHDASLGIIVKDIKGLEPVKADIVISNYALAPGGRYQASRRGSRNITMRFALDPRYGGESVQQIRHSLYSVFMPEMEIEMDFYLNGRELYPAGNGTMVARTTGWVESFDAPLFTKDPEAYLSIICPDPDFLWLGSGIMMPSEQNPFTTSFETVIDHKGTVETGFEIFVQKTGNISTNAVEIYCIHPNGYRQSMNFNLALAPGEQLIVKTREGSKDVAHWKNNELLGSKIHLFDPEGEWLTLVEGENTLGVNFDEAQQGNFGWFYQNYLGGL